MKKLIILLLASMLVVGCTPADGEKEKEDDVVLKDEEVKGQEDQKEKDVIEYDHKIGEYGFEDYKGDVYKVDMSSETAFRETYMFTDEDQDFINRAITISYPKDKNFPITEEYINELTFTDDFVQVWFQSEGEEITDILYKGTTGDHLVSIAHMGIGTSYEDQTSLKFHQGLVDITGNEIVKITVDQIKLSR